MPTQKRSYKLFDYILYEKNTIDDLREFREEIVRLERGYDNKKDIIVDLTKCTSLISAEIGVLAKIAKMTQQANRYLRIVCPSVKNTLQQMNLTKMPHIVLYESMQELISQLRKEQVGKPLSQANTHDTETLLLEDSLTGEKVKDMSELVQSTLRGNCKRIVLDLSGLQFVDTMFVGELITLDGMAKGHGKSIVLSHPREAVLSLLREASMDKIFKIVP